MTEPINKHPMQIRKDLQETEAVPIWDTRTGELGYVSHTPTLDVEYMWAPDEGELNSEGANTILKIHRGRLADHRTDLGVRARKNPALGLFDALVYAISIDWEDKESPPAREYFHEKCLREQVQQIMAHGKGYKMTEECVDKMLEEWLEKYNEGQEEHKADRSVNCYFCNALSYDNECIPADPYNDNDGGSICPRCVDEKSLH